MWNTFKYTILALIKEKTILIWALAFPLIMASLFNVMFSGLDEAMKFSVIPTAIVDDNNYQKTEAFVSTIEALSEEGNDQVLETHFVTNTEEAEALLCDGAIDGYFRINNEGEPLLFVSSSNELNFIGTVNETILKNIADNYLRTGATVETLIEKNPMALADESVVASLFESSSFTKEITLTANQASGSVRYFYALLGFAAIMAANVSMIAITRTQANLSALGARRALGSTSRTKTLTSTLLASWLLSFVCLFIAFCYLRFVLDIGFGGRDLACILSLVIASLMATALGAAIGSIPKLGEGTKAGVLTGLSCLLALFAGLYGTSSQRLADDLARSFPMIQQLNPSKQITDLFYSLYFYDGYDQFFSTAGTLLAITAVLFLFATIFMRRQRYASI